MSYDVPYTTIGKHLMHDIHRAGLFFLSLCAGGIFAPGQHPVDLGLASGPIDLQILRHQELPAPVFKEQKRIRSPKPGGVIEIGVFLRRIVYELGLGHFPSFTRNASCTMSAFEFT